ncbi:DNA polymerase thumb domain-containing protein [Tepidimonas sp.]|uniref:DNA polymerase Y family protein n=1 Tax=Tepidimonas sp. TaxID=2002775 RepID=UPI00391886EA
MDRPPRRIAHLDMDAFYASVEGLRYPQLRDVPLVIGGRQSRWREPVPDDLPRDRIPLSAFARLRDYRGRGVITTANYAARQHGVGSAMGLMKAARLCPDGILLPVDFDAYRAASRAFKAVILRHAPVMEDRGIDEVYIDFTHAPDGQLEGGRVLAERLQRAIRAATGLSCSIGVAPNKLLAKIASDLDKPGGITLLDAADVPSRLWPLPCRKIHGIGPRTDERLQAMGLRTIGELAACPRETLIERFGASHGAWLHDAAWGRDERPLVTASEPVSLSRETTFERDLHAVHDRVELGRLFTRLCEQVAADLQRKGYVGRTIGIKLRYEDFRIVTRDQTVPMHTADAAVIRRTAGLCLKRVDLTRPIRLLGVRVGNLARPDRASPAAAARPRIPDLFDALD